MSRPSKQMSASRLADATLGVFSRLPSSDTVAHLVRYLSTWSGSDKFFMIVQYTLKIVLPFLEWRARTQHRAGLRASPSSSSAPKLNKLAGIISDSRTLWRIWGLLPIIQWLIELERAPPSTRSLLNIERLQGWSMLAYYPLEHLAYLAQHGIVASLVLPFSSVPALLAATLGVRKTWSSSIKLDVGKLYLWSCRFWMAYVLLQFAHLREDHRLLKMQARTLRRAKSPPAEAELKNRWDALLNELIVNVGYLPLTIHWSLESGLFKSDILVSFFGLLAGIASWRAGWRATALPKPVVQAISPDDDEELESQPQGHELAAPSSLVGSVAVGTLVGEPGEPVPPLVN